MTSNVMTQTATSYNYIMTYEVCFRHWIVILKVHLSFLTKNTQHPKFLAFNNAEVFSTKRFALQHSPTLQVNLQCKYFSSYLLLVSPSLIFQHVGLFLSFPPATVSLLFLMAVVLDC